MIDERCSTCFYNKKDYDLNRYYCNNEKSDRYDDTTEYHESCEHWVPKEFGK